MDNFDIYVGIDPSINSTGICILTYKNNELYKENFYIVKPNKLTKKEQQISIKNFEYKLYEKYDLSEFKSENRIEEYYKTLNFIAIVDNIFYCVKTFTKKHKDATIYICQEGISYGSTIRTKSVFDLAGLNFMIRQKFCTYDKKELKNKLLFFIGTPGEIKKFATGKGNANKELMKLCFSSIHKDLTIIPKYDDLADAYFMANYAKYVKENSELLKVNEQDISEILQETKESKS